MLDFDRLLAEVKQATTTMKDICHKSGKRRPQTNTKQNNINKLKKQRQLHNIRERQQGTKEFYLKVGFFNVMKQTHSILVSNF